MMLFDTFINTFIELGRGKSTKFIFTFKGAKLEFNLENCFNDKLGVDIFEVNKCPIFITQMLDTLSPKLFDALY